jgi:DNA-binding transcriptional MerR regulator
VGFMNTAGFMTIGEFAGRTRLSPKALRLYDELGLVVPARVDPSSGYRLYAEDQVERARIVGLLRQVEMPLARIAVVVGLDGPAASQAVEEWWLEVETTVGARRELVSYLRTRLAGTQPVAYDIEVRAMPERSLVAISRHVHKAATPAFFDEAFTRLRRAAPGIVGIAGVPFVIFYGEVSEDSDGPIELCRPVVSDLTVEADGDRQLRIEPAHEEAYVRLASKDMGWPAMVPACDALDHWLGTHQRRPAGPLRQLLIADQRTATPETLACDLAIPLR